MLVMYSFIRELPYSQSFPPIGFIPETFRSKIEFFRYNHLPPIKEEEGNVDQIDIELRNFSLRSQTSNNKIDRTNSYGKNERQKLIGEEWTKREISAWCIPPLVNINCLMNVDMKQQSIWKTSFGRRLINGKAAVAETASLPVIKKKKQENEKLRENQRSNLVDSSQSFFGNKNIQLQLGDDIAQTKKKKMRPVKVPKKYQKTEKKKKSNEQSPSETASENITCKREAYQAESSLKTDMPSSKSLTDSLVKSRKSRSRNYLFHCVQNILGDVTTHYICKYCDELFLKVEELSSHQQKHEREKEICILCNKVFYNRKEFIKHLLSHESIDKFSCKKCKEYFPSLKKYKAHYKNVHLKSLKYPGAEIMCNMEPIKEQTLKYVCKRCQLELDSEENMRDHRRYHIRFDLMGAYLLSNKNTLNHEA